ncbi:xanthine dehydrogenase/oxidase isoform X1 [Strongylocentrotus purpuratus]|uniref:Xanthine dehydrogenase n=1 Tax=Strongylocentrotus purpuratus TaxID=7668 RepID=A0A7M7P7S4_STRPU|nr:xanthine dehydrogenase/oxidase isoform X1 [Strongylocentrotus purpuratus]
MPDKLIFFCNGKKIIEKDADPDTTLDVYLRTKLKLHGTKQACGVGACGACTVMLSYVHPQTKAIRHEAVVSCLTPICLLHGKAITTVEGIGSTRDRLHVVQERLAKSHGSQCGFCSPGMVMSMYTLLRNNPKPQVKDILRHLEGNLCRCTGYRPILDGFKSFCGKEDCCQRTGSSCQSEPDYQPMSMVNDEDWKPYDPSQEPIFPPELLTNAEEYNQTVIFRRGQSTWVVTSTLEELLQLLADNSQAQLTMGSTIMSTLKYEGDHFPLLVSPGRGVTELTQVTTSDTGVTFGSGVSVSHFEEHLRGMVERLPEHQTRSARAITDMLGQWAGQQIRNMASIGGSIAGASGMLDLCIILMATKTTITLVKAGGARRTLPLDKDFYPEPNKSVLARDEIIESLHIPFTGQNDYFFSHKVAERRDNSRASISCGFRVTFEPEGQKVKDLCLVFGAIDDNPFVAQKTCNSLIGQPWNQSFLQDAIQSVTMEITPIPHPHEISAEYRKSGMVTCLLRFYVQVSQRIDNKQALTGPFTHGQLSDPSIPASYNGEGPVSTQIYQPPPVDQPDADPLGRPIVHRAALQQCSGEAVFCDDIPVQEGELYMALVVSSRAHAKIVCVDASKALALEGVEAYVSHKDIPGDKCIVEGYEVFATEEVHCVGQCIGAIVATSHRLANKAAKLVEVQYEDLQPVILTIQDAIKEDAIFRGPDIDSEFHHGDLEGSFQQSEGILEGTFDVGGQEHFYMETQMCVVRPGEDDEMTIHASAQAITNVQNAVARVLGVPRNRIAVQAKRIGGAFGGKEEFLTHNAACAVAAKMLGRSVRIRLDRSTDMLMSGGRHPFHAKYRVGYRSDGRILALDADLYANAGYRNESTTWVVRQSMLVFEGFYSFPGFRVKGHCCRTNMPSNTAMRGFGAPQSLAIMEQILSEVAIATGVSSRKVQELNFKPDGALMIEGANPMEMDIFKECWDRCLQLSDYEKRLNAVEQFNRVNTWKKRGLSIVPTKHGIGIFGLMSLNQGAALVHIYTDGSVLVNHAGIEMGQGLYTKLIQVASRALDVPVSKIHTSPTAVDKVPNTTVTGGSTGTDLHGTAVKIACDILKERLEPYQTANPKGTWEDWVSAAYNDRVSLSTTGFYKRPFSPFDWNTLTGNPYFYFTMGAGVSEVEIDCLTGEHQLLRTDIVMDVGKSINPAIDIGQIEGGFLQGYGYFTMEEKRFNQEGALTTDSPDSYKIPSAKDIPKEFNVTLLRNMRTPEDHLYSSKGIGEPPFFIGASVFFAIKHALTSSRSDNGLGGVFKFNAPATVQNVRMTCGDLKTEE